MNVDEVDTLGAIAPRVDLAPNVLGNYARRYPDFPPVIAVFGKASVYEIDAVIRWVDAYRRGVVARPAAPEPRRNRGHKKPEPSQEE